MINITLATIEEVLARDIDPQERVDIATWMIKDLRENQPAWVLKNNYMGRKHHLSDAQYQAQPVTIRRCYEPIRVLGDV